MFCRECGKEVKEGAAFCPNCGASMIRKDGSASKPEIMAAETDKKTVAVMQSDAAAQKAEVKSTSDSSEKETGATGPKSEDKKDMDQSMTETQGFAGKEGDRDSFGQSAAGDAVSEPKSEEKIPSGNEKAKKGKGGLIAGIAAAMLVAAAGVGCVLYFTGDSYNSRKNMKLAEECLEEQEYDEALKYYKAALDLDETLQDAYLKSADIYILENDYEDAIKFLERGIKKTKELEEVQTVLTDKLIESYGKGADYYVAENQYEQAYALLAEGIEETKSTVLTARKVGIYLAQSESLLEAYAYDDALAVLDRGIADIWDVSLQEKKVQIYQDAAKAFVENGAYDAALSMLNRGIADVEDASLLNAKVQIYRDMAESSLENGAYEDALYVLNQGIADTGDVSLEDQKIQVYLRKSDAYLVKGEYERAVLPLQEGQKETGAEILKEREDYLLENIVVASCVCYRKDWNGRYLYQKEEYDSEGRFTKTTEYDAYGNISSYRLYEYDGDKCTKQIKYDVYGNVDSYWIFEYNDEGKRLKQNDYDAYGTLLNYWLYEYNEKGQCIKIMAYNVDGVIFYYIQGEYDDRDNKIKERAFDGSGENLGEILYNYNILDMIVSETCTAVYDSNRQNYENSYTYEYAFTGELTGVQEDSFGENSQAAGVADSESASGSEAASAEAGQSVPEPTEEKKSQFILPDSDSRYLTVEDLAGLTKEECRIARNELFARHGRLFSDEELQEYFNSCEWYHGTVKPEDFDESVFNEYEFANRDLIIQYEKEQGYR